MSKLHDELATRLEDALKEQASATEAVGKAKQALADAKAREDQTTQDVIDLRRALGMNADGTPRKVRGSAKAVIDPTGTLSRATDTSLPA